MGYIKNRLLLDIDCTKQIRQEFLILIFAKIRILVQDCIQGMSAISTYPQAWFLDQGMALALGYDRNRSFFKKNGLSKEDNEEWAACDAADMLAAFLRKDEDFQRAVLVGTNINRLFFEECIEAWLGLVEGYGRHAMASATADSIVEASAHAVEMDKIERLVNCTRPEFLFGMIRYVERRYAAIRKLYAQIVEAYCRLSLPMAKATAGSEAQENDSFQNGILGLIRAAGLYDHTSMMFFMNFARMWVNQAILFNLKDKANTVKMPTSAWQQRSQIDKARAKYEAIHGPLSIDELADFMEVQREQIDNVIITIKAAQMKQIDYPLSVEEIRIQRRTLPSNLVMEVQEDTLLYNDTVKVESALPVLNPTERMVVCLHFGLLTHLEPRTPTSNPELQYSIERLRQLS